MRFSPSAETHVTNWWSIYPGAVVSMLSRLGFGQTETTMHTQHHHLAHDIASDPIEQQMYTVVGRREPDHLRTQNRLGVPRPLATTDVRNSS